MRCSSRRRLNRTSARRRQPQMRQRQRAAGLDLTQRKAGVHVFHIGQVQQHLAGELQANARLTNAELAQRVGLSAAPCWRRVRALEQAGFILSYRAVIDRHKIGLGVLAFVRLDAERNTGGLTLAMEDAIRQIPEVVACHYISGTGTFELQVVARDLESFSQFAREVLLNLPNVKDMHTSFSLGEVKAGGALPLAHLRR